MPVTQYPDPVTHVGKEFFDELVKLPASVLQTEATRKRLAIDVPAQLRTITDLTDLKEALLKTIKLDGLKEHRSLWSSLFSGALPTTWSTVVANGIEQFSARLKVARSNDSSWCFTELYQFLVDAKAAEPKIDTRKIEEDLTDYLNGMPIADITTTLTTKKSPPSELTTAVSESLKSKILSLNSLQELGGLRAAWHTHLSKLHQGIARTKLLTEEQLTILENLFYQQAISLMLKSRATTSPRPQTNSRAALDDGPATAANLTFDQEFRQWFPRVTVEGIPSIEQLTRASVYGGSPTDPISVSRPLEEAEHTLKKCGWVKLNFTNELTNTDMRWGVFRQVTFHSKVIDGVNMAHAQAESCRFEGARVTNSHLPLLYIDQLHFDDKSNLDCATMQNLVLEAEKIIKQGIYDKGSEIGRGFPRGPWQAHIQRNFGGQPIQGRSVTLAFTLQQLERSFNALLPNMAIGSKDDYLNLMRALDRLPQQFNGFDLPFTEKRTWRVAVANLKWKLIAHASSKLQPAHLPVQSPTGDTRDVEMTTGPFSAPAASAATAVQALPQQSRDMSAYNPPLTMHNRTHWRTKISNLFHAGTEDGKVHARRLLTPMLDHMLKDEYTPTNVHRDWFHNPCANTNFHNFLAEEVRDAATQETMLLGSSAVADDATTSHSNSPR